MDDETDSGNPLVIDMDRERVATPQKPAKHSRKEPRSDLEITEWESVQKSPTNREEGAKGNTRYMTYP